MIDFETLPLYWVNRLSAMSRRELGQRFKSAGYDVSPEEWAILLLLWRQDSQNPGVMSARTVRDPTTMTRLIDGMVRKEFVERRADTSDRRRSNICLTDMGRSLEQVLTDLARPMIEAGMAGVSENDFDTTVRVLKKMVANMDAAREGN